jgi:hypothetical protein
VLGAHRVDRRCVAHGVWRLAEWQENALMVEWTCLILSILDARPSMLYIYGANVKTLTLTKEKNKIYSGLQACNASAEFAPSDLRIFFVSDRPIKILQFIILTLRRVWT